MSFEKFLEKVELDVKKVDMNVMRDLEELSAHTGLHLDDDQQELVEMYAVQEYEYLTQQERGNYE